MLDMELDSWGEDEVNKNETKTLPSRSHHLIMETVTSSDLQHQLRAGTGGQDMCGHPTEM